MTWLLAYHMVLAVCSRGANYHTVVSLCGGNFNTHAVGSISVASLTCATCVKVQISCRFSMGGFESCVSFVPCGARQ